ncbi:MAG: glycosyltransferase [Ruthenibacterium lactatiformans]
MGSGQEKASTCWWFFAAHFRGDDAYKLFIIGDGPRGKSERQIARLGVVLRFVCLAALHQFLPPYYHMRPFTTASLSEMNSISMLEAMASGLYVIQRLDIYNKNQITPGENGNVFNTAEEMAALLREEAALTPEQRALRRQKVTAFTQRYGEKEFIRAVLNVYERAMAEYKAKMKIKAKAKSKGVR